MKDFVHSLTPSRERRRIGAVLQNLAIAVLVVAVGGLFGCGGYRAPSGGSMPGQAPRTYPMPGSRPGQMPRHMEVPSTGTTPGTEDLRPQ